MKRYRFLRTVVVRGKVCREGEEVGEKEIPPGCLAPLLRVGHLVRVVEETVSPPEPVAPPKSPAKK